MYNAASSRTLSGPVCSNTLLPGCYHGASFYCVQGLCSSLAQVVSVRLVYDCHVCVVNFVRPGGQVLFATCQLQSHFCFNVIQAVFPALYQNAQFSIQTPSRLPILDYRSPVSTLLGLGIAVVTLVDQAADSRCVLTFVSTAQFSSGEIISACAAWHTGHKSSDCLRHARPSLAPLMPCPCTGMHQAFSASFSRLLLRHAHAKLFDNAHCAIRCSIWHKDQAFI